MGLRNRLICIFLPLIALASCGGKDKKSPAELQQSASVKQPPLSVEAFIAHSRTLDEDIEVPGSLLAFETTEIHPEISGRIVQLNIKEGGYVTKGTLLAKIYDEDLAAQLKKLQVQMEIAKSTEERQSKLLKIQGISQQDYDLSLLNVNNLKADMDIIRTSIVKTEIRAPFSGKIGLKNISPGAYVTPSTVLTTISQVDQLKLQFTVPEKYSSRMSTGQEINFTIEGSPKTYSAKVMASEVYIEEDTRSLSVRAVVKSEDKYLTPGSFAKVSIQLGTNDKALMIPSEAIIPAGRKKQIFLFKGGKALTTDISTGVRDSANVEVLTGLNQGDTVITTGILFLHPGSDVIISKVN